jgi:hypothetical protein
VKYETLLRGSLAASLLGLIILQFFYFENFRKFAVYQVSAIKQIDSLTMLLDSMRDEQFNLSVEIGRHELTREEMFIRFPNLEKQYSAYYEHETE